MDGRESAAYFDWREAMSKLRIGQGAKVERMDGSFSDVIIMSRELHNHREFYRVWEIPGALFLSSSLKR